MSERSQNDLLVRFHVKVVAKITLKQMNNGCSHFIQLKLNYKSLPGCFI